MTSSCWAHSYICTWCRQGVGECSFWVLTVSPGAFSKKIAFSPLAAKMGEHEKLLLSGHARNKHWRELLYVGIQTICKNTCWIQGDLELAISIFALSVPQQPIRCPGEECVLLVPMPDEDADPAAVTAGSSFEESLVPADLEEPAATSIFGSCWELFKQTLGLPRYS